MFFIHIKDLHIHIYSSSILLLTSNKKTMAKLEVPANGYLRAGDLDIPKKLKVTADAEYKKADQFGNTADGKSYFYSFEDEEGNALSFQNNSVRLARAWNDVDPEVGDWVEIGGSGAGVARQYTVAKVTNEDVPFE